MARSLPASLSRMKSRFMMASTVASLLVVLCLLPTAALAGRQANPLVVFAADGTEHALLFRADGIRYQARLFVPVGPDQYLWESTPEACTDSGCAAPPCEIAARRLWVDRKRQVVTLDETAWRGCTPKRRRAIRTVTRHFSFVPQKVPCKHQEWSFWRGKERLHIQDGCDGTLQVTASRFPDLNAVVSAKARGRYAGRGVDGAYRWQVHTLRFRPGATRLRISGRIQALSGEDAGQRWRLRGIWKRQPAPPSP